MLICSLSTITLKYNYYHIEIYNEHWTYLGFSWRPSNSSGENVYVFAVLLFGLSTVPHIFTKVLKPLEKHCWYQNISIAIFLDDGWLIEKNKEKCRCIAQSVQKDLISAGFIPNEEKSIWETTQVIDWLGITWDTQKGTICIIERRIAKIKDPINNITQAGYKISARKLASFVGQIISTGTVVRNIFRIMTRHCSMSIASAPCWDKEFILDDYCKQEWSFWQNNLNKINERNCFIDKEPSCFVYSDASATGCGSTITLNKEFVCHKMWEQHECHKSSTWRELAAIEFSLLAFVEVLTGLT